jgi:hypothetical protein
MIQNKVVFFRTWNENGASDSKNNSHVAESVAMSARCSNGFGSAISQRHSIVRSSAADGCSSWMRDPNRMKIGTAQQ